MASYPQIGVAIARSSNDGFAATMKNDIRVQGVSATNGFGVRLPESSDTSAGAATAAVPLATTGDSLSNRQWDMDQIQVPAAHEINTGVGVLVGDIDTGIDFTNPDLAANIDVADSANCLTGTPVQAPPPRTTTGMGRTRRGSSLPLRTASGSSASPPA